MLHTTLKAVQHKIKPIILIFIAEIGVSGGGLRKNK